MRTPGTVSTHLTPRGTPVSTVAPLYTPVRQTVLTDTSVGRPTPSPQPLLRVSGIFGSHPETHVPELHPEWRVAPSARSPTVPPTYVEGPVL